MKKLALAAMALAVLAGLTACQKDVTMWSPCQPAADGNPTGTDGTYVLACRNGTWEPIMTVKEWIDIHAGRRVTIAPLPTRPAPTTTSTTSTTSTTMMSTIQTIDLGDAAAAVGDGCGNCAGVMSNVTFGDGRDGRIRMNLADQGGSGDGGYSWDVVAEAFTPLSESEQEECKYPILSFRARATIEDTTYRMDFDGDELGIIGSFDLEGPWDHELGDQPTAYAESITVDWGGASCSVVVDP